MAVSLAAQSLAVFASLSPLISFVTGECLFAKYHGYRLPEATLPVGAVEHVGTAAFCEILCFELSQQCAAANIVFVKPEVYVCEMFTELPPGFTEARLIRNDRGKFIRRKDLPNSCLSSPCQNNGSCQSVGTSFICICPPLYKGVYCHLEPHKLAIESCDSGSIESAAYVCKHAYDGVLEPGDYKEWSSQEDDDDAWLRLDFATLKTVGLLSIWWRCAGESQFSELKVSFSDGSSQMIKHQCSSETNWLGCTADDPEEVFYLDPVSTTYVNISGVDCMPDKGNNGFREVEIWGV